MFWNKLQYPYTYFIDFFIFLSYIMGYRNYSLTWSNTRITLLEYCNKKYFFNYYPHALRDVDQELRLKTLLLKNLKSMDMRVGEKTHHLLSDYLYAFKEGKIEEWDVEPFKNRIIEEMRSEFEISKTRDYISYDRDRKFWLSEHYYAEDADSQTSIDDRFEESIQRVTHNLDVFLQSDRYEKVQHYFKTAKNVYIEKPRERNFEGMKVNMSSIPELKDLNVMAAPDFGVVFSDTNYLIVDRKTGKEKISIDGTSDQLKVYALKLLLKARAKIEDLDIEVYEVYLPSINKIGGKIEKTDIDAIIEKIKDDVEYQKQFIVDGDIYKNEALSHQNFARTTNEKKCAKCTFRRVCEDIKKFE